MKLEQPVPVTRSPPWSPPLNRAWAVGQLLNVTVIGPAEQNSTVLRIGTDTLIASGPTPVPAGGRFMARVVSLQPLPTLAPVLPTQGTPAPKVTTLTLRTLLPQQLELAPALRELAAQTQRIEQAAQGRELPPLVQSAKALLAASPSISDLTTPAQLRQAVGHNGLGLEEALAQRVADPSMPLPTQDRKWQLLSLLRQIDLFVPPVAAATAYDAIGKAAPAPGSMHLPQDGPRSAASETATWDSTVKAFATSLKENLEGMTARITTRQLQITEATAIGQSFGLLELPVRVNGEPEVVQLEYSHAGHTESTADAEPHTLLVMVPLPGPSQLRVRLTLCAQRLSVVAWANDETLRQQLCAKKDDLQTRLAASGLGIGSIIVAPVDGPDEAAYLPLGLIDTEI